jgi:hypothetical protein
MNQGVGFEFWNRIGGTFTITGDELKYTVPAASGGGTATQSYSSVIVNLPPMSLQPEIQVDNDGSFGNVALQWLTHCM